METTVRGLGLGFRVWGLGLRVWGYIGIMEKKMETSIVYWGYKGLMERIWKRRIYPEYILPLGRSSVSGFRVWRLVLILHLLGYQSMTCSLQSPYSISLIRSIPMPSIVTVSAETEMVVFIFPI